MKSSIVEFSILKNFQVVTHYSKSSKIVPVDRLPPDCGCIKVNSDGAAEGSPGLAGEGAIFRDKSGAVLG